MTPPIRPLAEPGWPGQNTGHGHVFPRPDGARARCGGPALCSACRADAERKRELDTSTVQLDPVFLMYAFRYALGRMTYAVGDVAAALIAHADRLRPEWRQQIIRDIEAAIADDRAGMRVDVGRWRHVAEVMAPAGAAPGEEPSS